MNTLIIRHITGSDPASFELMRLSDGKRTAKPVEIPSPTGFPVEGCPNSELMSKLRWYGLWLRKGLRKTGEQKSFLNHNPCR